MSTAIDIALILIIVFGAWRGFKNGFVRGIFGLLAIIIAIYGANLVAKAYSGEFTGMLEPFVGGIVDNSVTNIMNSDNTSSDEQTIILPDEDKANVYDVSYTALRRIGVAEEAAQRIAEKVESEMDLVGQKMSANLTEKLCEVLAFIAVFGISFILILIIFAVMGNIINLAFSLPGIETADRIIGLFLGLFKGVLIVFAIAVVGRYIGLISSDTINNTTILKYIINVNPIANILGI